MLRLPKSRKGLSSTADSPAKHLDRAGRGGHCCGMTGETEEIESLSFEDALRALEGIVRQLESGDVPLEDSITLYEKGDRLRLHCQKRLDSAQARIERIVTGPDGSTTGTQPFDADR